MFRFEGRRYYLICFVSVIVVVLAGSAFSDAQVHTAYRDMRSNIGLWQQVFYERIDNASYVIVMSESIAPQCGSGPYCYCEGGWETHYDTPCMVACEIGCTFLKEPNARRTCMAACLVPCRYQTCRKWADTCSGTNGAIYPHACAVE